ncbi:radical SAM protein [bacterium]|nr:radical SAM protein [bacterium]
MYIRWIHKIEPSSLCNRKCEYCVNPQLGYKKGNMSMETFNRILYWARLLNPTGQPQEEGYIHFRGIGEPLLNPYIVEMTGLMSDIVPVWISTNGDFLTEDLLKELIQAHVGTISVSRHDEEVANRCEELLRKYNTKHLNQDQFNDDWAGQLKDKECTSPPCYCAHIETGGAMVIWDGRIVTCCVDSQAEPVLGSVHDDELRHIAIKPIPLCADCRSNFYWKWKLMREFSLTLEQREKERYFREFIGG